MSGRIIRNLSIAPSQEPRPERAEPRLLPSNAPMPLRRPAAANPGILSATREDEPNLLMSPALAGADRRPVTAMSRPAGVFPYLVVAGLVDLAVGAFAGVRFLMLTMPSTEMAAAARGDAAVPPHANPEPEPTSPQATTSHPAAPAAIPSPPPAHPMAADNADAKSPGNVAPASSPTPPSGAAPVSPAPASGHAASPATSHAAAATKVAAQSAAAAGGSPSDHPAAPRPTGNHRSAHTRIAERRSHARSLPEMRSPAPHSRSASTLTSPQSEPATSFDRLVTQLTEPAKPVDQSLTPPAPGAADPFAPRPSDGQSAQ